MEKNYQTTTSRAHRTFDQDLSEDFPGGGVSIPQVPSRSLSFPLDKVP